MASKSFMKKPKYKYILICGLIYRIKPDWRITGFNEFLSRHRGKWEVGVFSRVFADSEFARSISPRTVKFFEQEGGYNYDLV